MSSVEFKSILNEALFWSYNCEELNVDRAWFMVIEQVFACGDWNEFKAILKYYSKEQLIEVALNSKEMDIKSANFISTLFEIPLKEMKSYHPEKLIDKGIHVF